MSLDRVFRVTVSLNIQLIDKPGSYHCHLTLNSVTFTRNASSAE